MRKRTAGVAESSGDEPDRKKRLTEEMVEGNGFLLLSISDKYAMDTADQLPVMSVPAQTDLEYTETVSTEQVPTEAEDTDSPARLSTTLS
ncbi:hypothetical protein PENNAL_c0036G05015 [Penicillium nalgiovense]|uniref:Uncharacterized protein n=1 Tax=Penicillium nalgiovense TaxID=60175 RepID=A0A1V6Y5B1_PENNA|nr:hypothetical protein PENNAL_c0036G05015 [Penicillium nalgiovense]